MAMNPGAHQRHMMEMEGRKREARGEIVRQPSPKPPAPGPPMDLANMRKNGVRALYVACLNDECRHDADVNVDDQPAHLPVPSFATRMRCSICGSKNITVRPAWHTGKKHIPTPAGR